MWNQLGHVERLLQKIWFEHVARMHNDKLHLPALDILLPGNIIRQSQQMDCSESIIDLEQKDCSKIQTANKWKNRWKAFIQPHCPISVGENRSD